jgi:hypothetical protein
VNRRGFFGVLAALPFVGVVPRRWWEAPGIEVRRVYAYRGDMVTCEKGHRIGVFLETLRYGDINWGPKLWFIDGTNPMGRIPPLRCSCGAEWCRSDFSMHFSAYSEPSGWRDHEALIETEIEVKDANGE